jgi:hypothetical protein
MGQRVIVGIEAKTSWALLKAALQRAGAQHISEPTSYQPDAVVATLQPQTDAAAYIKSVQRLAGVRYAELDAMSGTC